MNTLSLRLIIWVCVVISFATPKDLFAVQMILNGNDVVNRLSHITVQEFLAIDVRTLKREHGNKLRLSDRLVTGYVQKNLAKQVRKGKLTLNTGMNEALRASSENKRGLLSVIFSAAGLLFLFIPYVNILGLGLSIAGFVLGIIGLKRDADPTLAVIGTVLGGLALLIYLLAIVAIAAWFSLW